MNNASMAPLSALPGERVVGALPSLVSALRAWADSPTPLLPLAKLLSTTAVQVVCPHLLGVAGAERCPREVCCVCVVVRVR